MTSRDDLHTPPLERAPRSRGDHHDELGFPLPAPARPRAGLFTASIAFVVLALGGSFLAVYLPRRQKAATLAEEAAAAGTAPARVEFVVPKLLENSRSLTLPGSVHAFEETTIFARANGYVKKWNVDIGDKVKEGDALAEIETPELDQEIVQARAELAQADAAVIQATANRDLSRTSLERYKKLAASGVATAQELDERSARAAVDEANLSVAHAAVGTQRANVARLEQLKSFARVTAPFAGTITARMIDRGALVAPGSATPLFKIAAVDPVRVFVEVPQDVAPGVRAGEPATVMIREYPDRKFEGKVARTSGALDEATRTMNTEVRVPNPDGALISGMHADVSLSLPIPHRVFGLPATAVLTDASGVQIEVVREDGTVHLLPITIERDLGSEVQVASGLTGTEHVVKLASAELTEGLKVDALPARADQPSTSPSAGTGGRRADGTHR
jgi:RND family efflux transporter MFP subunit